MDECPPNGDNKRRTPAVRFSFWLRNVFTVGQRACARQTALASELVYTYEAKSNDHAVVRLTRLVRRLAMAPVQLTAPPGGHSEHMPQLDGLRAFAVTAVAVSHWTPAFLVGIVPWGTGVQLFFVLSGFLITGILLRSRPADLGLRMGSVLRVFYIRRFLRIFPLYYGVLASCLVFGVGPIHDTWPWHVSYMSNLYYAWHGHGDAVEDPFLHFWSLAVEEQFYLLWPLITLVASRRTLLVLLYVFVAGSMLFRVGVAHLVPAVTSIRYLTPSCLDALAVGALVAHAKHYRGLAGVRQMVWGLAMVGFGGLVVSVVFLGRIIGPEDAHRVGHTFLVIFYGFIVAQASMGFRGPIGALLSLKPILYLGRISYGLYVFHYFAPIAMHYIGNGFGIEAAFQNPVIAIPADTAFTILVSAISWHFYEWPINRLKRHFDYPRRIALRPPHTPQVISPIPNV